MEKNTIVSKTIIINIESSVYQTFVGLVKMEGNNVKQFVADMIRQYVQEHTVDSK